MLAHLAEAAEALESASTPAPATEALTTARSY
jgi:hypothetical protein